MHGFLKISGKATYIFIIISLIANPFVFGQTTKDMVTRQIDLDPELYDTPRSLKDGSNIEINPPMPYSPADGSTVKVNPPPFSWTPVKNQYYQVYRKWVPRGNFTYRLEISKDKNFTSNVITRTGIDYNTYALEQNLEPGVWYWRYAVEREEIHYAGTTLEGYLYYSKVRQFKVPPSVKTWYLPDIREVINKIPKQHPRLFIKADQVASYRERAKDGDLQELCNKITKSCDPHIGEELIAEPPYRYGIGTERGKLSGAIMRNTRPPMNVMETCGLAYILTGDKKYGEEAKRRIIHFFGWDPYGSSSYESYDEPAMWVMMRGIRAYDWTYDLFSPAEREQVEKVMKIRASQFYDHLRQSLKYEFYPHESHANRTIGFLGEASLCFANEWDVAEAWLKYVLTMYWNIFPVWGRADGGWHEGPSYWSAYMSFAVHFIVSLKNATGLDLMEKQFFKNTPYYCLYSNPPYAKISPYGDGEHRAPGTNRQGILMYQFSTLLQDPYTRWYADYMESGSGGNVLGVVLKDDKLIAKIPADLPQSRLFEGIGLASIHTNLGDAENDVHLLFHSDPFGPLSHAHADQNAFTIEAFGEPLAIASGYYPWYNSNHHRNWQWETRSSNSVTIDGWVGQAIRDPVSKGKIVAFENHDLYDYVVGDATDAYQGLLKKFKRHIVHIRPGTFIMLDELEAPKAVTFEWWLHALSEMDVNENEKSIKVSQGDVNMKVLFQQKQKLDIRQFSEIPYPPERNEGDQWHITASTITKTESTKIVSVMIPYKKDKEPDITIKNFVEEKDKISLDIDIDGKKYTVNLLPKANIQEMK